MGKEDITTIPYVRKCFYATYANLPVAGIRIGDLGFATDRLVLYRWSGVAWEYLTFHFSSGIAANIPTAADLPDGSCYFETDTSILKQVQAGAWVTIVQAPVSPLTIAETEVFNAGSPTSWTDLNLSGTVGAQATEVMLKVLRGDSTGKVAFRKNGDTDEFYWATVSESVGIAAALMNSVIHVVLKVLTDNAGIIEWKTDAAYNPVIIDVMDYIK